MEALTLGNILSLSIPDGFKRPGEAECKSLFPTQGGEAVCIKDDEKHIMLSFGTKQINAFSALLLGKKDIAKAAEKHIAAALRQSGYAAGGFEERSLADSAAPAFRYTYTAQNTPMAAECAVLKQGKTLLYLNIYVRQAGQEDGFRLWEQMLSAARFVR